MDICKLLGIWIIPACIATAHGNVNSECSTTIGVVANDVSTIRVAADDIHLPAHTHACDFFMLVSVKINLTGVLCSFLRSSQSTWPWIIHATNPITSEHSALLSYLLPFHSTSTKSGSRTKSISDTKNYRTAHGEWVIDAPHVSIHIARINGSWSWSDQVENRVRR